MIADFVTIRDYNHDYLSKKEGGLLNILKESIVIGKNCWLGSKVTINSGISLGDNVVVGANSVVTKDFGSNLVIGGCPARILKKI